MLLVKVWVPKTHPSFEKRETTLQFFLAQTQDHQRTNEFQATSNMIQKTTLLTRHFSKPHKTFLQSLQGERISPQNSLHFMAMNQKNMVIKKLDDLPQMRNFFYGDTFCYEILCKIEKFLFEIEGGNLKKCASFSLFDHLMSRGMK